MEKANWRVVYHPTPLSDDGDIYMACEHPSGAIDAIETFTMRRYDNNGSLIPPTIAASAPVFGLSNKDLMQAMLDGAWKAGFRPTGYDGSKERTDAMGRHLEDMRALAFHYSKASMPK